MGLFSIFKVDVNFQNLIEIHIGGQVDKKRTENLPRVIGDVWVINDLKMSLKAAHMAYQDFGATFSDQMNGLLKSDLFEKLATSNPTFGLSTEQKSGLGQIYNNAVTSADLTKRRGAIEDCDPTASEHTYYVLRGLMDADYRNSDFAEHLARLKKTGKRFFASAGSVLPALKELDQLVAGGAVGDLVPHIKTIGSHAVNAASAADTLMDRAEKMLDVARLELARIIPNGEDIYRLPGLELR